MGGEPADPTRIRTLAVTAEDVVTALEARRQRGSSATLRVTPPFSGRMRARLHVRPADYDETPAPLHVSPEALLEESAPAYPRPAETGDRLRGDPDAEYTVERHHERHREAVAAWRERVRRHLRKTATVETPDGPHEVTVSVLG